DVHQAALALPPGHVLLSVSLIDMAAAAGAAPESLLGDRIRYARADLRLSIEALSRLTKEYDQPDGGLSPTSISRYESGESLPGLREFRLIAESLDVPPGWLIYGTLEEKKPEFPDGHPKLLHLWPPKLPQAGRLNYQLFGLSGSDFLSW
ncbi:MAG: helix-turn-helix transcriptional regulator, partial [Reyranella sp.]|nr:helix-turn-helix transcriptional regulator [Reyranella sp.]